MMNSTRMIYFNKLYLILKFVTISKELYWFNEDSYNIQSFYFKDWENSDEQIYEGTSVIVGVKFQIVL